MTDFLLVLWSFSGIATVLLLIVAIGFALFKKKTKKLWLGSGVSAIVFVVLFFAIMFSNQYDLNRAESTASSNQVLESDEEPQTTELYTEEQESEEKEVPSTELVTDEEYETNEVEKEIEEILEETFDPRTYQSGIDISELERRPDEFAGQKFMYQGKIIQVMETDTTTAYLVAINDDYNHVAYIQMPSSTLEQRYLDNDYIIFYGYYGGLYNYDTAIGGENIVPIFVVSGEHIELIQ